MCYVSICISLKTGKLTSCEVKAKSKLSHQKAVVTGVVTMGPFLESTDAFSGPITYVFKSVSVTEFSVQTRQYVSLRYEIMGCSFQNQ